MENRLHHLHGIITSEQTPPDHPSDKISLVVLCLSGLLILNFCFYSAPFAWTLDLWGTFLNKLTHTESSLVSFIYDRRAVEIHLTVILGCTEVTFP